MNAVAALGRQFLGGAPGWYKAAVLAALALNPLLLAVAGPFWAGWALLVEFLGVLAMALPCYPLAPGGLLALEAVLLGLVTPEAVYRETAAELPVLLLLVFMVAGIYFLRDAVATGFVALIVRVRRRLPLALMFLAAAAVLSAFLDALTVMAIVITVAWQLHRELGERLAHLGDEVRDRFRRWLAGLVMQAAVGTALGGVLTLVGEPQNLLLAKAADWHFAAFFVHMAPVSLPVLAAGIGCCLLLEWRHWFGYGVALPPEARRALREMWGEGRTIDSQVLAKRWAQALVAILLILALAFHVAEIGLIGLAVIVVAGALTGARSEHDFAPAFHESLPFAALLVVFFAVVGVIEVQQLFDPITRAVLGVPGGLLAPVFYLVNGALSAVSDNVFVASIFLKHAQEALAQGHVARPTFEHLIAAINAGTNLPSVATPNGQAAFLFLLASPLAPLLRLSYGRMMWMALPYTVVLTAVGLAAVWLMH